MDEKKKHLSVTGAPDWRGHPEAFPEPVFPLDQWHGQSLEWEAGYQSSPVFIAQFALPDGDDLYLFGLRFEMSKAKIPGETQEGYFIEYLVLEWRDGGWRTHRLRQDREVTYSSSRQKKDHIDASDLGKRRMRELSLGPPPRWKPEDGIWPTSEGNPMRFVGQATLLENAVTTSSLTVNTRVFVFTDDGPDGRVFKITTQDDEYQSAEDHYRGQ